MSYDPDRTDPDQPGREALLRADPAAFRRQGLYRGRLEVLAAALVHGDGDGQGRCKTFGEFDAEMSDRHSTLHALLPEFAAFVGGFHPATLPVMWRVLLAQFGLYRALVDAGSATVPTGGAVAAVDEAAVPALRWSSTGTSRRTVATR